MKQWTATSERRFLRALGETANVRASCAVVGLSPASAYNHRHRWDRFAQAWDAVIDETVVKLEFALVETGGLVLAGEEAPVDSPIREMTVSEALYLVEMFKRRRGKEDGQWGRWRRPRSLAEVRGGIIRKLEAIEAMRVAGKLA